MKQVKASAHTTVLDAHEMVSPMVRWKIGEAEVQALLSGGELQELNGATANGDLLLARASTPRAAC